MEAKQIKMVKKLPELKLVQDISVFLGFANFYQQFIKEFGKIVAQFTLMLKTNMSSKVFAPNKMLYTRMLAANEVGNIEGDDGSKRVKSKTRRSKSQKLA